MKFIWFVIYLSHFWCAFFVAAFPPIRVVTVSWKKKSKLIMKTRRLVENVGENFMTLQKWSVRLKPVNLCSAAVNMLMDGFLLNFAFKSKVVDVSTCVFFPSYFLQSLNNIWQIYVKCAHREKKRTGFPKKNQQLSSFWGILLI